MAPALRTHAIVRPLAAADLPEVIRIAAAHERRGQDAYWRRVFERFCGARAEPGTVGLCVDAPSARLAGYLFGEVREVEFDSDACGWVFAVGVDPQAQRRGTATALLREAVRRFRAMGVRAVRTMVARNDVPVLSFFRASGFVGGPFVQLELPLPSRPSIGPQPRPALRAGVIDGRDGIVAKALRLRESSRAARNRETTGPLASDRPTHR